MKRLKQYNWKAILIATLVVILSFGAWQYLSTKTNQAETQRKLEAKQLELTTKLNELDSTKLNAKQLEEAKKQLESQKQELEKQLQARKNTAKVYAEALPATFKGNCADWVTQAGIGDVASAMKLIGGESGCNPRSYNTSSGACGIPQSLPCGKLPNGIDTDPVTQLRWMDSYIKGRYGSWANAYATWSSRSPHWY